MHSDFVLLRQRLLLTSFPLGDTSLRFDIHDAPNATTITIGIDYMYNQNATRTLTLKRDFSECSLLCGIFKYPVTHFIWLESWNFNWYKCISWNRLNFTSLYSKIYLTHFLIKLLKETFQTLITSIIEKVAIENILFKICLANLPINFDRYLHIKPFFSWVIVIVKNT